MCKKKLYITGYGINLTDLRKYNINLLWKLVEKNNSLNEELQEYLKEQNKHIWEIESFEELLFVFRNYEDFESSKNNRIAQTGFWALLVKYLNLKLKFQAFYLDGNDSNEFIFYKIKPHVDIFETINNNINILIECLSIFCTLDKSKVMQYSFLDEYN